MAVKSSTCKYVRSIAPGIQSKTVYLTFDDGPQPYATERVLELLARLKVEATFFCVANKAQQNSLLFKRIIDQGHAIGNHSLDHQYSVFFAKQQTMQHWIEAAEQVFTTLVSQQTVGFRSPAGVVTPPLKQALATLNLPLVHWNKRFFDSILPLTERRAVIAAEQIGAGSIVLLHDAQKGRYLDGFLRAIEALVQVMRLKGLNCGKLSRKLVMDHGL